MKQAIAERLAEDMGEIREAYRGRGMRREEFAVVFDNQTDFQSALVFAAFELGQDNSIDGSSGILYDLTSLRVDSMGLGIVVY